METAIGLALWAIIIYGVYRAVRSIGDRKRAGHVRADARAAAEAAAAGGSGGDAAVVLNLVVNLDGQSLGVVRAVRDDATDSAGHDPSVLRGADGPRLGADADRAALRALPAGATWVSAPHREAVREEVTR